VSISPIKKKKEEEKRKRPLLSRSRREGGAGKIPCRRNPTDYPRAKGEEGEKKKKREEWRKREMPLRCSSPGRGDRLWALPHEGGEGGGTGKKSDAACRGQQTAPRQFLLSGKWPCAGGKKKGEKGGNCGAHPGFNKRNVRKLGVT